MKLTLRRVITNIDETGGLMYLGKEVNCHTLEDEHRAVKVPGETCIPADTYAVKVRPVSEGRVNAKYLAKFPTFHQGMLWLQDVPGFTYVYIHMGNKESHTDACILVGQDSHISDQGRYTIPRSEAAYVPLYKSVIAAALANDLTIEVIDDERF